MEQATQVAPAAGNETGGCGEKGFVLQILGWEKNLAIQKDVPSLRDRFGDAPQNWAAT